MLKRLPNKNQRSKGIRLKHVLQICLLLGVCFWLVYQVKHSHDKKKEFDEKGAKVSIGKGSDTNNEFEILRLGRKDLPREGVTENEKLDEEEEEEKRDEERDERESKSEEEEENKNEESENGDEVDENDEERKDEDFVDGDKEQDEEGDEERQTNENVDLEDQVETENSFEDQDDDVGDHGDHEAREEHYRADDASSEVAHEEEEAHDATPVKVNLKYSDENLVSHVKKVDNSQLLESKQSDDQEQLGTVSSNSSTEEASQETSNGSKETRNGTSGSAQRNSIEESATDSGHRWDLTGGDNVQERASLPEQTNNSDNSKAELNSTVSTETDYKDEASEDSTDSSGSSSSIEKENREAVRDEKSDNEEDSDKNPERGLDSADGTESEAAIQHDQIDSTDTWIGQELNEARTDLETLPDLTSQGDDNEEAAAE